MGATLLTTRSKWMLWFSAVGFLTAFLIFPPSYRATRLAILAFSVAVWFGLVAFVWKRKIPRLLLLSATVFIVSFLMLPSRVTPPPAALRADYLAGLRRYEGIRYYWGGESSRGIDCSGLIRRGLIDALFQRGVRTADAGLVRQSIDLWWHDCTANALGEQHRGLTVPILETSSINDLDHSKVLPGDLAVTASGVHIMAYLGDHRWIEADPGEMKVIIVAVPSADNAWFRGPMKIVRWSLLQ